MVLFKKRMNGFNLTGTVLIAFIGVSCGDFPAQDMVHSGRTDSWNASMDAKSSQKKGTKISKTTVSFALEAAPPEDWNCAYSWYGTDDGCDCGCGVIDPDCNGDYFRYACEYTWCEFDDVYSNLNHLCQGDAIKIMPVGDSITAGEHWGSPVMKARTGYRKHLYKYLTEEFYNVDFVGSQEHGKKHDSGYDYNSEAYPGKEIPYIADRLEEALPVYRPDVLLVHVGTNGGVWGQKPDQVEAMLDMINNTPGKKPTWVLLCEIINRFDYKGKHGPTTTFNDRVRDHAEDRLGDEFNIIMVDMEEGAGFNYLDEPAPYPDPENLDRAVPPFDCSGYTSCGDMWGKKYNSVRDPGPDGDPFHPNDLGNRRMAWKFEEVLISTALVW
jgi:lysophospholipase L1-like esterase